MGARRMTVMKISILLLIDLVAVLGSENESNNLADIDLSRLIREAGSKKENLRKAGKCKGRNCGKRKKDNARKSGRTSKRKSKKCKRNDKNCKRNHRNKVRKSRGKKKTNA